MPLASGGLWPERNFVKYCFETTTKFDILISVLHHWNQHLAPSLQVRGDTIFTIFQKTNLVKRLCTIVRHAQPSKKLRLQWQSFSLLHMSCCIYWFGSKVKHCLLLWGVMSLYLLPHRTMVWYLRGKEPHSNQLHFYHLVTNTMASSVEIFCTIMLHSSKKTYSSSK